MNRKAYAKAFSEALVLLDLPVENGRKQRGIQIASDPDNVSKDGYGWLVESQSGNELYRVTGNHCDCPDAAPRDNGVKWCKHRVAVSLWTLANTLLGPLAAVFVSEQPGLKAWHRQHWQVADEGMDRLYEVYLKREAHHLSAICKCGGLRCSQHKRMVCRHVRRAVEKSAARRGKVVSWSHDRENAVRLARIGGELVTVTNDSGIPIYGVARDSEACGKPQETDIEKQRRERDNALLAQPERKERMWK